MYQLFFPSPLRGGVSVRVRRLVCSRLSFSGARFSSRSSPSSDSTSTNRQICLSSESWNPFFCNPGFYLWPKNEGNWVRFAIFNIFIFLTLRVKRQTPLKGGTCKDICHTRILCGRQTSRLLPAVFFRREKRLINFF